jgi:hypothetical protein
MKNMSTFRQKALQRAAEAKLMADRMKLIDRATLVPFGRRYILFRRIVGWLLNLAVYIIMWLVNLIYGALAGDVEFNLAMRTWLSAFVLAFFLVEPSEILILALLPQLEENPCVMKVREKLKDWGFY